MAYTVTLAIGLILVAISVFKCRESLKFLKQTDRAEGVITRIQKITDGDGESYKPYFTFTTADGQEVIYKHNFSSNITRWSIGDRGIIAYSPYDPGIARLVSYWGIFSWSIVLMAIAMPMIVVSVGYYLAQLVLK